MIIFEISKIMSRSDFIPDPELQIEVTRNAELCVKFMRDNLGKTADYSEAFLPEVESFLESLHATIPPNPPEDYIGMFCAMFGSYLGETYRRNRGGEWGLSLGDTPTLAFGGAQHSYPWERVHKRLINGDEDNVHHWYLFMIRLASGDDPSSGPVTVETHLPPKSQQPLPVKKGFFSRFFGR